MDSIVSLEQGDYDLGTDSTQLFNTLSHTIVPYLNSGDLFRLSGLLRITSKFEFKANQIKILGQCGAVIKSYRLVEFNYLNHFIKCLLVRFRKSLWFSQEFSSINYLVIQINDHIYEATLGFYVSEMNPESGPGPRKWQLDRRILTR